MVKQDVEQVGRSSSATLVAAMRILATDIQSDDGVANAAIGEAADRIEQLEKENAELKSCVGMRHQVDGVWLKSIGFVESSDKDYVLGGWLVIACESGKWRAYIAKSSHWHCLCVVDTREDVMRLVTAGLSRR